MNEYPRRLLPQPHFPFINSLNPYEVLCRWSHYPIHDELGKLSALAIEEKRIPTYSTNKIPPSEVIDVKIAFHDKNLTSLKWTPGEDPIDISPEDFFIDELRNCFFIQIKDIDGYKGLYPVPYTSDELEYRLTFIVKIVHDPLKVNYSHCCFEIQYYDMNGNPTKTPSRNSLERVVIARIRTELIRVSKFKIEDFQ